MFFLMEPFDEVSNSIHRPQVTLVACVRLKIKHNLINLADLTPLYFQLYKLT